MTIALFTNNFLCSETRCPPEEKVERLTAAGWRLTPYRPTGAGFVGRIAGAIRHNQVAAGALTVAVTQRFQRKLPAGWMRQSGSDENHPVSAKQFVCNREFLRVFRRTYAAPPVEANGFGNAHVADHFHRDARAFP